MNWKKLLALILAICMVGGTVAASIFSAKACEPQIALEDTIVYTI